MLFILVVSALSAFGQASRPETNDVDDLMDSVESWAQQNLDERVLSVFQDVDRDQVRAFLLNLQEQYEGTNIYRLGPLKVPAEKIILLLDQYEETAPFAAWLRTRLDYLETARKLQKEVRVLPGEPGQTNLPPPSAALERKVWKGTLAKRPLPPDAVKYVAELKRVFAEEGLPPELIWVAEVESSFDPRAESPAGACGLFQFMPAAAHDQGLSTWPWDERTDPDKSTHAAARMLLSLHRRYGNWRLALAAYNAGPGRVDSLLQRAPAHAYDAIARELPAETQMYVPKIEATLWRREGRSLKELER